MKKRLFYLVPALVLLLLVIQLIPVARTNPPVTADIPTSPEVKAVLKRACYNCHSNETVYPWYSHLAPVSWLIARDVAEGRKKLDFSNWDRYNSKDQNKHIHEIWENVSEGEMPPWYYRLVHREARLSSADQQVLRSWAGALPRLKGEKDADEEQGKRKDND
jgi:hypothetical protein